MPKQRAGEAILASLPHRVTPIARRFLVKNWRGTCPICERGVRFYALGPWYRDELVCGDCGSLPRERALMRVLQMLYPEWRSLSIHESSPGDRGVSRKLRSESRSYTVSQFDLAVPFGELEPGGRYRSESLEAQTFPDESFDLVVTQDVFEHLFRPDKAIAEIARTLRPGGAHIMTVPIVNKSASSRRRASLTNGEIEYYAEAQYHGNPIDDKGSLVTVDWGYDIVDYLSEHSGLPTTMFSIDDLEQGIHAEYIEVVATRRGAAPALEA